MLEKYEKLMTGWRGRKFTIYAEKLDMKINNTIQNELRLTDGESFDEISSREENNNTI